jgi:hypothetical protein
MLRGRAQLSDLHAMLHATLVCIVDVCVDVCVLKAERAATGYWDYLESETMDLKPCRAERSCVSK